MKLKLIVGVVIILMLPLVTATEIIGELGTDLDSPTEIIIQEDTGDQQTTSDSGGGGGGGGGSSRTTTTTGNVTSSTGEDISETLEETSEQTTEEETEQQLEEEVVESKFPLVPILLVSGIVLIIGAIIFYLKIKRSNV